MPDMRDIDSSWDPLSWLSVSGLKVLSTTGGSGGIADHSVETLKKLGIESREDLRTREKLMMKSHEALRSGVLMSTETQSA